MGLIKDGDEIGGIYPWDHVCVFGFDNYAIKQEEDIEAILKTWDPHNTAGKTDHSISVLNIASHAP